MLRSLFALTLAFALLAPSIILAENSTSAHGYTVHHNAFKAEFLSPEIATHYGIQRSKYRGVLNVSVIRDVPGAMGEPVTAFIDAAALELSGKRKPLGLREVQEQEAVYYIDDFPIVDGETVRFQLKVRPDGSNQTIEASFSQEFYVD